MPNASSLVEGVEEASLAYEYVTVNGSLDFYNHAAASFLPLFSLPLEQRGGVVGHNEQSRFILPV